MKNGFKEYKIGDILHVERGGSPRPIQKYLTDDPDGLNWIKISDATASNKYIYRTQERITRDGLTKTRQVFEGDFLLSNSMSFGRPYIMRTSGCIHDGWLVLRDSKVVELDQDFLYHILSSPNIFEQFDGLAAGSTVRNLNIGLVSSVKIPVPPIEEQRRIVAILDEAFEAIDKAKQNAEKNLQNARELFESHLQSVFSQRGNGWVDKRIGEVATHSLGKMLDKSKNQGILRKYLRNQSVRWFDFDLSDIGEMRFLESEKDKYTAIKGDVLICEGGYPGRAAIWPFDEPIYFQKAVHRVRFHDPLLNRWFVYFLFLSDKTGNLRKYFTGTGIQHFTGQALARFILPVAPESEISLHLRIFEELDAETQRLESVHRSKIAALDELKKSLLHKAFNGEL